MANTKKTVLLVEDNPFDRETYSDLLQREGHISVEVASSISEALNQWDPKKHAAVIVDMELDSSDSEKMRIADPSAPRFAKDGEKLGRYIQRQLRAKAAKKYPIFGMSVDADINSEWFNIHAYPDNGIGVYNKQTQFRILKLNLFRVLNVFAKPSVFIVHGNDEKWLTEFVELAEEFGFEVKTVGTSGWGLGHWLDLIEDLIKESDFAWVIHTPDDWVLPRKCKDEVADAKLHARPNVIFEHGLLFGKFGRDTDRVFVFRCGDKVEMPSDINLPFIQVRNCPLTRSDKEEVHRRVSPMNPAPLDHT
jgi:CheY-like chemotaxis protein